MKKVIKLTENDLKHIILESVKGILNESEMTGTSYDDGMDGTPYDDDPYLDATTSVYHITTKDRAQAAINGNLQAITTNAPFSLYGNGIYCVFHPRPKGRMSYYGDTVVEILLPASAVKPRKFHDYEICVVNPEDVYEVRPYNI